MNRYLKSRSEFTDLVALIIQWERIAFKSPKSNEAAKKNAEYNSTVERLSTLVTENIMDLIIEQQKESGYYYKHKIEEKGTDKIWFIKHLHAVEGKTHEVIEKKNNKLICDCEYNTRFGLPCHLVATVFIFMIL